jgi:DNA repair photolyase
MPPRPVSNPPNPWAATRLEWLDEEPPPDARLEVFEEEAASILSENDSPDLGFRFSVNPYRGCFHSCAYCIEGATPVLMADGTTRPIRDLRPGDAVYGTVRRGRYRRYAKTRVLAHWSTEKPAHRITLADGTELVASGDHRFLTERGWKHVTGTEQGRGRRPHLTRGRHLLGIPRESEVEGRELSGSRRLGVVSIEPVGPLELFDIMTGTGDFVANGVVSHNCYARPTHQYLGFGAGTDFDRKIVVKTNAPRLLRASFERPSWKGERVVFSGNTDCYQPLEAHYRLTRGCLETCLEFRNPVSIITKGSLVRRDVDVLSALAKEARAGVGLSIPFAREEVARRIEPYVGSPSRRFETMRLLSDAGIPTAIGIAPVIPGLNDADIPALLERARDAGARRAFLVMLRLPGEVVPVFRERLAEAFPERAGKVWSQIHDVRGGRDYRSEFGERQRGRGPRWDVIQDLFEKHCARLGLDDGDDEGDRPTTFRRPGLLFPE